MSTPTVQFFAEAHHAVAVAEALYTQSWELPDPDQDMSVADEMAAQAITCLLRARRQLAVEQRVGLVPVPDHVPEDVGGDQ